MNWHFAILAMVSLALGIGCETAPTTPAALSDTDTDSSESSSPSDTSAGQPQTTVQVPESEELPERETVTEEPVESGGLLPPDEPLLRQRRRMDVPQLKQAVQDVTGGITWTTNGNGSGSDLFDELAPTLGEADFIFRTEHEVEASPVFQKYLKDAAISVCTELAAIDPTRSPNERILFKHVQLADTPDSHEEAWEQNIAYLLLRYHGRKLATDHPDFAPWRWLAQGAYQGTASTVSTWRTVCVGLMVHPDFYTY